MGALQGHTVPMRGGKLWEAGVTGKCHTASRKEQGDKGGCLPLFHGAWEEACEVLRCPANFGTTHYCKGHVASQLTVIKYCQRAGDGSVDILGSIPFCV